MKIEKLPPNRFGKFGALTLDPSYIGIHDNGWSIEGEIKECYYEWVNEFKATKKIGNKTYYVKGDFETEVYASNQDVYNEFIKLFPPTNWDYKEI